MYFPIHIALNEFIYIFMAVKGYFYIYLNIVSFSLRLLFQAHHRPCKNQHVLGLVESATQIINIREGNISFWVIVDVEPVIIQFLSPRLNIPSMFAFKHANYTGSLHACGI